MTSARRTHEVRAERGLHLTLDDLESFVQQCRKAEIPGNAGVVAKARFNGAAYALTVDSGKVNKPRVQENF